MNTGKPINACQHAQKTISDRQVLCASKDWEIVPAQVQNGDKATTTRSQRSLVYRTTEGHTCLRRCLRLLVEVSRINLRALGKKSPLLVELEKTRATMQTKEGSCQCGAERPTTVMFGPVALGLGRQAHNVLLLCIHLAGNVAIG